MDDTEGFGCLGHSNWTICTLLSHFCSPNFPTFSLSCWEANSYYPRGLILRKGNSPNFRNGWDRDPGHSNWAICSLLSHFCSLHFATFSLSCWEANSYNLRGLILRKGNSPNFRNGWDRGSGCQGHSNWAWYQSCRSTHSQLRMSWSTWC